MAKTKKLPYEITNAVEVSFIEKSGTDKTVPNAARVSFSRTAFDNSPLNVSDINLTRHLAYNNPPHWTPFGHVTATICMCAPIYVLRHIRTSNVGFVYNEESLRYRVCACRFHLPDALRQHVTEIKQGSGEALAPNLNTALRDKMSAHYAACHHLYQELLDAGVCREQARIILPVATYSSIWVTGSLYAFARLCHLRLDSHVQAETRAYAEAIDKILSTEYPIAWNALMRRLPDVTHDALLLAHLNNNLPFETFVPPLKDE